MYDAQYLSAITDYYNPSYIDNEDIKLILNIVVEFFNKHNKTPNLTEIKVHLTDEGQQAQFKNVLQTFKTLDSEYNEDELYANTEQFLRERAVFYALLNTTETLSKTDVVDTEEILQRFDQACTISLVDDLGFDYLERIKDHCEDLRKPNRVIPIGWKWLDDLIGGGLDAEGKAIYVFTGFTNVGKSIFLGNIALNIIKQDKVVLLVSLEMSEKMYAKRMSSSISQLPFSTLHEHTDELDKNLTTFKDAHGTAKLIIKEFPTKGVTINHLNSFISKLIKKGIKPDVIVVDYLNLFKGSKKGAGLYDEVKDIAEQLRGTTYRFNMPCVTASQLGRSAAGVSEPGMEKTSESIGTSFTADVQCSIWSEDGDKAVGQIHLGMQKNRFGQNYGSTTLSIKYETLTLTEKPQFTTLTNTDLKQSDDFLTDFNKQIGGKLDLPY